MYFLECNSPPTRGCDVTHCIYLASCGALPIPFRDHLKLCLGVFYRPPSSENSIDTFSDALLTINQSCLSDLIIIGDFNVNFHPSHYMYAHLCVIFRYHKLSSVPLVFRAQAIHQLLIWCWFQGRTMWKIVHPYLN